MEPTLKDEGPIPTAGDYGQALKGLGISLLVRDLERSLIFAQNVLQAHLRFSTNAFAALRLQNTEYVLHQDETYRGNAALGLLQGDAARGLGIELRVYNLDPDAAEQRARALGFTVLAGSLDKPHGLRECLILDDEGYLWCPSVHTRAE